MFDIFFKNDLSLSEQLLKYAELFSIGIFNHVDKSMNPELFMISFTADLKKLSVSVFPENQNIEAELFKNLPLLETCLPNKFIDTKDLAANAINIKSLVEALLENSETGSRNALMITDFNYFDNTLSAVVTLYNSLAKDSHYQLLGINDNAPKSLIDALCLEYQSDLNRFLNQISRGYLAVSLDYNDTTRKAAKSLIKLLGYRGLWDTTYSKLRKIASTKFSNVYASGKILFGNSDDILLITSFINKIPLTNHRYIRKLLELTNDTLFLVSDSEYIVGVGQIKNDYDYSKENIFMVEFTGMNSFELSHYDIKLMQVTGDQIGLPFQIIDYNHIKQTMKSVFPKISFEEIKQIHRTIMVICRERKDASIIISTDAANESLRLVNQNFSIVPVKITSTLIKIFTDLEGAILMSTDGTCYSIGCVLDGLSSARIDHQKGPRYNNAVRYVETQKQINPTHPLIAFIVNENGSIDVFY